MLDGQRVEVRLAGDYPTIPSDKYTCQITNVDLKIKTFDGEETPGLNFELTILDNKTFKDETGEEVALRERKLWYWVSTNFSPRSNLGKFTIAAFGRDMTKEEMEEIKTKGFQAEDLIDRQIDCLVEVADGKGKNLGRQFNNVVGVSKINKELTPVTYALPPQKLAVTESKPVDTRTDADAQDDFIAGLEKDKAAA